VVTVVAVAAGGGAALALNHHRPSPGGLILRTLPIAAPQDVPEACGQLVDLTSNTAPGGSRIEFGAVAVPPAIMPEAFSQANPTGWRYAQKTGFGFLGNGPPDVISVPAGWQKTVALATPNGPASKLFLPPCQGAQWNIYISEFYLRSPTACVPLRIQVGPQATTAWFGLGRRCNK